MQERIYIFVVDRGFVIVGRATLDLELPFHWLLTPGRTVRVWGTKEGLAELKDGPTADTKLDVSCVRRIPFRSVIEILEVSESKWKKHLSI